MRMDVRFQCQARHARTTGTEHERLTATGLFGRANGTINHH